MTRPPQFSKSAVLEILQELIRTPSVNPNLAPDEAYGEEAIAKFAQKWLAANGLHSWLEEVAPGRPNVVAEVGSGNAPTLIFCAHLDTVGTKGMVIPPFEPRVEGARVYGRGSYDMKGSVAAVMSAAAALGCDNHSGRVLVALVADEEYASVGAQDFVKRHKADGWMQHCSPPQASQLSTMAPAVPGRMRRWNGLILIR